MQPRKMAQYQEFYSFFNWEEASIDNGDANCLVSNKDSNLNVFQRTECINIIRESKDYKHFKK